MSICSIVRLDANMGTSSAVPTKISSLVLKHGVDSVTNEMISKETGTWQL